MSLISFKSLLVVAVVLLLDLAEIQGHGRLMDPVNRSSLFRIAKFKGKSPANYNDNEIWCGGRGFQEAQGGRCGVCGDKVTDRAPRQNENGGFYGKGVIVRSYKSGERFTAKVELSASHKGYFEFAVCPLDEPGQVETEECFAAHPVKLANGFSRYYVTVAGSHMHVVELQLPAALSCQHCSFRWHYTTGHNPGLKQQETFRNCADISIV
ncbi:unnamed protein product [Trichogramma brassicae]|uniref:Chitin-binding type-4 domain-containing protein n=1 Tax=Trichogramma brassicae TaxID=86971 RepID=A0A6H5IIP4_9HYME|nr:unnamed protein product [Trichogramma brassicae]